MDGSANAAEQAGRLEADLFGQVAAIVAAETGIDPARLQSSASFEELGLTSMDVVTVLSAVEERFDLYLPMDGLLAGARTLGAFVDGVAERIAAART